MLTGGLLILYLLSDFSKIYLTIIFSFWIPQIYCNITRECVKPLLPYVTINLKIIEDLFVLFTDFIADLTLLVRLWVD